ncbi:hypothetical protein HXX76_014259 [Chlamydomonas incerta]|uniref:Uncharacterized protein n=1 Tax=Chlamydomonas incerta TaxID=51695 RepID=A0A835SJN2_CHLIN|nr:hypothetical protein HXX76_014259 [Chlamydomonas incerta]|eukprot:KAG2424683.1 hypothetical protein HXX76_014259 [Chlamydomonas incerta]
MVSTPREEAGGHTVTITAYGRDRTLAAAVLQLIGSRPASLFQRDHPLHGAVLNFRTQPGNSIMEGDTQVLVVMREVEGADADYQTMNMLKRAGEASVRKLLGSALTLGDLRRRLLNYHGSILWSMLSCSVRIYGKSTAEQQNLRQGHCPAPLFKYVMALNFSTGHQAEVLHLARHVMLGVRNETVVLMSALPFPPPAAELRAEDTHVVLLRNETFATAVRPTELLQVLQALRTRAAEQDSACRAFAWEVLQQPELLLVSPSDDPNAGVQLQEEEDDCGFTPSSRSSTRAAPTPQAHGSSRVAQGLQEAHARARQAGGHTGRRALVLNSSRDELTALLGSEAANPSSVITSAHWCSRKTGQLCPVSLHLVRYGPGGITFKAPDDSADLALVCATPHDTASICAAAWGDACFNPVEYASNQPSGLYLKGPSGNMTLTLAGIMSLNLGGRYVHTSYDGPNGSSSTTTDPLLQKPTTTVVIARNLLAGEHYLTGAEQAYNLETFRFAYQKQTGFMLYHPPTALSLQPTRRMGSPGFQARETGRRTLLTLPTAGDTSAGDANAGGANAGGAAAGAAGGGTPVGTTQRSLTLALQQVSTSGVSILIDDMENTVIGMRRQLERASLASEQMSSAMANRDAVDFQRAAACASDALDQVHAAHRRISIIYLEVANDATAATRVIELLGEAVDLATSANTLQTTYDAAITQAQEETARQNRLDRMQRELEDLQRTQEQQRAQQREQRERERREREQQEQRDMDED